MLLQPLRSILSRRGYVLWKRDFLRFGIDPWLDIARLSKDWGQSIETVFDVGANDGGALRELLPAFPSATVHSFEPLPETFERLKKATTDPRARLHNMALGETCGAAPFYVYGIEGDGSLINSLTPNSSFALRGGWKPETVEVQCSTIDAYCEEHGIARVDVLKVDTEGFDLHVLRGARRMFGEGRVWFVYVEFNDLLVREGVTGGALFPLAEYLSPFGLRYVATYTDFIKTDGAMLVVANALFAKDLG